MGVNLPEATEGERGSWQNRDEDAEPQLLMGSTNWAPMGQPARTLQLPN